MLPIVKAVVVCWLIFCAETALAQKTETMVSNLGQIANSAQSFGSAFNTNMSVAGAFLTDNTPGLLSTISVKLFGDSHPFGGLGACNISLYSDSGGQPGGSLATLSGNNYPTNVGSYTFTNTSPLALLPNTTYWVVASSPDSVSNAVYSFGLAANNATDAGSFWTIGVHKYKIGNESWFTGPGYAQISVAVTPQAPALSISRTAAAGSRPIDVTFPTPDFPFTLKQNSALTTNWVNATGAVILQSNQMTIVSVPISGQRMFFRLILQ